MRRGWPVLLFVIAACSGHPSSVASRKALEPATFLVKDINSSTRPTPEPAAKTVLAGTLVFAFDDDSGEEVDGQLWRTDGTTVGSELLFDFGPVGRPGGLTPFGGAVYFSADDGGGLGRELWRTDGTPAGTTLFKDILSGSGSSRPHQLLVAGTILFFEIINAADGYELWKSDGTSPGTVHVADLPGPMSSPVARGGTICFRIGNDLWTSDGQTAGTALVGTLSSFSGGVVAGSTFYFPASDVNYGLELWSYAGAAPAMVKNLVEPGSADPSRLTAVGSTLFFAASDGAGQTKLWKSDGTADGTVLVKDANLDPVDLTAAGGLLYFTSGGKLWSSDGTSANTVEIKKMNEGVWDLLAALGSMFVFTADDGTGNTILWKKEGDTVTPIEDLFPDQSRSCVYWSTADGQRLYFYASACDGKWQLYVTDGTAAGTHAVVLPFGLGADSRPGPSVELGNLLLFVADDGTVGKELWRSDGTALGTQLVKDINPGEAHGEPDQLTVVGGFAYFLAVDDVLESALWRSDGTPEGTTVVRDISGYGLTSFAGALYFVGIDSSHGAELWKSDGTTDGTVRLEDLQPGSSSGSPQQLTVVGDALYFIADDGTNGQQLWKTDGSMGGAGRVTTIPGGIDASYLTAFGNALYFQCGDADTGYELWRSDGTTTARLKDLRSGAESSSPRELVALGGTLYFVADDGTHGQELWKSDGTADGTVLVKDVNPGSDHGASYLVAAGGVLYFLGNEPVHGEELWKSDGSEAGTVLVRDLRPGPDDGRLGGLQAVGDLLVFRADDGVHGEEPFVTAGTAATTLPLGDVAPGLRGSRPEWFLKAGDHVFFNAARADVGEELFAVALVNADPVPPLVACPVDQLATATSASGAVVVYPVATAIDNLSPVPALVYSHASGSEFPLGATQVTASATDTAGNQASCAFVINVVAPLDLAPAPPDLVASGDAAPSTDLTAADLVVVADLASPAPDLSKPGGDDKDSGCAVSAGPAGGDALWLGLVVLALAFRRLRCGTTKAGCEHRGWGGDPSPRGVTW